MAEQAVLDGLALGRLRADEDAWAALERVVRQLHDDAVTKWSNDDTVKKAWLRGAREVAGSIIPAIEQRILDAQGVVAEEREAKIELRTYAEDGVGSGDLAIA